MKKIILALLMVSGLTLAVNAQNRGGKRIQQNTISVDERVKRNSDKAEKDLGLNADQRTKWEAALRERIQANQPVMDKLAGSTTPDERKELHKQAKVNNDKFEATVNAFLTPEQKTKMDAIKKERMEKRKARMNQGGPAPVGSPGIIED